MLKRCTTCARDYFARWRNESVELCPACRASVVLCATCLVVLRPPNDPAQMLMFADVARVPSRVDRPTLEERYWSLRAKATQAARRHYPYC